MTTALLITFAIITFSSFVKGTVGFGSGLVAAPLLLLFTPPQDVVVIVLLLAFLMDIGNTVKFYNMLDFRKILPLVVASLVGLPIGVFILKNANVQYLKLGIGILVASFAMLQLLNVKFQIKKEVMAQTVVGFLCGILVTATSINGPPVALFYANQNVNKNEFKAKLAVYFLILGLMSIATLIYSDVLTLQRFQSTIILVPSMLIGFFIGLTFSHYVSESLFKKIALAIIFISGLTAIASVIWG